MIALRFKASDVLEEAKICINIQAKSTNGQLINLGTQNYRFYYDASQLRFLRNKSKSVLPSDHYSDLKVVQAVHNSDASGYGNLEFSQTLGFVNMNIHEMGDLSGLIQLPSEYWLTTTVVCFESQVRDPIINMVWGRSGLTEGYATAFTRIGSVTSEGMVNVVTIDYEDFAPSKTILPERMAVSDIK